MKLTKSLFLAFAGLGLFACSNEDVTDNGGINAGSTVTVNISDAVSRVLGTPTTGANNQKFDVVIKNATLTLEAGVGGTTVDIKDQLSNGTGTITFSQVRNPTKLTLVINDGIEKGLELANVVETGLAEPLYATTTQFKQDKEDATKYTATLEPEHRLARLQFSGIDFNTESSSYTSLHLDGIYLNGAITKEGEINKLTADKAGAWATVQAWPVSDEINKTVIGAGAEEGPWPTGKQCYAYNILPNGKDLPKLTVCFSNAVQPNVVGAGNERYARVATYIIEGASEGLEGIAEDGKTIEEFVAGYIYDITKLTMEDEDLGPTPEGGEDITLTATVTVTPWTLVNGTVDWQ
jgi:hypothetical protein